MDQDKDRSGDGPAEDKSGRAEAPAVAGAQAGAPAGAAEPGRSARARQGRRSRAPDEPRPALPRRAPSLTPSPGNASANGCAAARKKRSQRRTVVVGLGVTALLAGTITAIVASNEEEPDYAQVCFNDETGERVEDTQCDNSSTAGRSGGTLRLVLLLPRRQRARPWARTGRRYPSYTRTVPSGAKASTGYSTKGGTVSRGGFGSSSKGGSTGG